jgi:hypothetical protein
MAFPFIELVGFQMVFWPENRPKQPNASTAQICSERALVFDPNAAIE